MHGSVVPLLQQHLIDPWVWRGIAGGSSSSSAWQRPLQLRVFALTQAAESVVHAAPAACEQKQQQPKDDAVGSSSSSSIGVDSTSSSKSNSTPDDRQRHQHNQQQQHSQTAHQELVWAELWVQGLPATALKAAAKQAAAAAAASSNQQHPAQPSSATTPNTNTTASTKAAGPATGTGWLPQRKRDVSELLLLHGLAHMADEEQFEWLGVRPSRWRAYQR